jgi:hypothetical protein
MMSRSKHGYFFVIAEKVTGEDKFRWTTYHCEDGELQVFQTFYRWCI